MDVDMDAVQTYTLTPSAPRLVLPANACDAHVHIFGPGARFPYASGRTFTPVDAPKEALFALHRKLGINRCVIVQTLLHGYDNRVVEDAIRAGGGRYLGVGLVPLDVEDAELARMAAAGFRGLRFHFMGQEAADADIEALVRFSHRLKPLRMHLQLHFESRHIHRLAAPLARSAVPVVLDHIGRVDAALGRTHADFAALHALLRNPLFHVKVSGVDRITRQGHYDTGVPFAAALVSDYPEQCVWGTDWPHPNHDHVPDDGALVDLLARIAPEPAARERLLVTNPQRLYRFDA